MEPSGPDAAGSPSPQPILIIDDDSQVLRYLAGLFQSLGFDPVFEAASAREALTVWQTHIQHLNLVVSDFVMPEVTGDHLALRMLHDKPAVQILFISGNDPSSLDSIIPLEAGRNFLRKPFSFGEAREIVQKITLAFA